MSFLGNLFGGADNAADAQKAGIQAGLAQAGTQFGKANDALTTNYTKALQPFQQNYQTAQGGVTALGNALGLGGPAGTQSALTAFQTSPGFQAALGAGDRSINAAAAAGGTLGSGKQLTDLSKFNTNTATQGYGQYVNQLMPYLNASGSAASGIGSLFSGLGSGLSANDTGLGQLQYNGQVGIGNAQASADLADQSMLQNLLGGGLKLGSSMGSSLGSIGSLLSGLAFSDERLKDDIEPVGKMYDGQDIYRYKYIDDPHTTHIGVIAQETDPDAVHDVGGFLAVDYGKATDAAAELARYLR